jgi:integrase/recombinase XerD
MLEVWLKEMEKRWRLSTLLNQVCIVDRFLDHLVEIGLIANNPVAVLRRQYNVKQNKPIWRALASPIPTRPWPHCDGLRPYGSVLGDFMRDHVALMRSRGYQYETQAHWLLRFDRFLQAIPNCRSIA